MCNWKKKKKPETKYKRAPALIGYGKVDEYDEVDANALADALQQNGLTLTQIEYVFGSDGGEGWRRKMTWNLDKVRQFVEAMRRCGITTLITIFNINAQTGHLDDAFYRDRVREVASLGTTLILLEPVSEPWMGDSEKARRWFEIAKQEWKGPLVSNGDEWAT